MRSLCLVVLELIGSLALQPTRLALHAPTRLGVSAVQQLPRAVVSRQGSAAHAVLRCVRGTLMMCAEGAAAEGASAEPADADVDAPAAEDSAEPEAAAPVVAEEEEEEEEDELLSSPAFLKQKIKVLEKELVTIGEETVEAQAKATEMREEWAEKRERLQADYENFKARNYNMTMDAQLESKIGLIKSFLPVLDNFDRARGLIEPQGEEEEAVNAKYEEMYTMLMDGLAEIGVEKIPTVGVEFDYNIHMAIQQVPSAEYEEGIVAEELQPGYLCGGKLVRAAYVMVSSG